jgi:trehalose 6-phosphate phosphatase
MQVDVKHQESPPPTLLRGCSLFLDFDGTLVDIAERHDAVSVGERVLRVIGSLNDCLGGRVAIISGRAADEVRTLLGNPNLAVGGSHGLEVHWPDGKVSLTKPRLGEEIPPARLTDLADRYPGVLVERKPFGVALHYRMAPEAETACRERAAELAEAFRYVVQAGKMVVELKAADADKGAALRALMSVQPMSGSTPVFIGDDETDEAGFAAAVKLGGAGVLVGAPRTTRAQYRLDNVEDTLRWLEEACELAA